MPSTLPFDKISINSESIEPLNFPLIVTLWAEILPITFPFLPIKTLFSELISPSNSPSIWIWHLDFNSPLSFVPAAIIVAPLMFAASNCLLLLVKIAMIHFSPY